MKKPTAKPTKGAPAQNSAGSAAPTPTRGRPFQKGVSGNPGGRPKIAAEVKAVLEAGSLRAAQKLVELVDCADDRVAHSAAESIVNRVIGKAREAEGVPDGDRLGALVALLRGEPTPPHDDDDDDALPKPPAKRRS